MALLGCKIPTVGRLALAPGIAAMAGLAEEGGARSLWVSDHVALISGSTSRYPYSPDGRPTWDPAAPWLEALSACAWLAAHTTTAKVGTGVLVLPQRDPFVVAKAAATIDCLSGGRFALGVGAGWYAEEFELLGWDFATRGKRLDEAIEVLRLCWTGTPPPFDGEFFQLPPGVHCFPVPVSADLVPVLVGGMSRPAIRRAARVGDAWLALARADELDERHLAELLDFAHAQPRDRPAPLRVLLNVTGPVDLADTPKRLRRLARMGFDEIAVDVPWADTAAVRARLEAIGEAIA